MKIAKIRIKDFQQFKDIELDFTHPETGEPLDKVCFMGSNGTGKSTLLGFIWRFLEYRTREYPYSHVYESGHFHTLNVSYIVTIKHRNKNLYWIHLKGNTKKDFFLDEKEYEKFDTESLSKQYSWDETVSKIKENDSRVIDLAFKPNSSDLITYMPAETVKNTYLQVEGVPTATLNESLKLITDFPFLHIVSSGNIEDFWKILIANIKKRENERQEFENASDNIDKSKRQLIEEFDTIHPKIMDKLSEIWNKILEKANLELDTEGVRNPIQLTDNLYAYIRTKDTKERVEYNRLSTGIRNFIFKIGHIYSLYFNRAIERGFLLVDEPENSLYPDFLFDLMEIYDEIVKDKNGKNNTQMFFATHNPIVAAQFEPYERIILAWDETGGVKAHKGTVPVGDDPNDILEYDFALKNLMGKKGQEKWAEYVNLKKKLIRAKETDDKLALAEQINKIGNAYNFSE
jgi:predicted ATPase